MHDRLITSNRYKHKNFIMQKINQSINRQNRWSRTPPPPLLLWPLCSGYSSDHFLQSSWRQETPNLVNFGPVLHPSHPVFLTCNESNDIMQMIMADFIIRDSDKESSGTSLKKCIVNIVLHFMTMRISSKEKIRIQLVILSSNTRHTVTQNNYIFLALNIDANVSNILKVFQIWAYKAIIDRLYRLCTENTPFAPERRTNCQFDVNCNLCTKS